MLYTIENSFEEHFDNGLSFTGEIPTNLLIPPSLKTNILGFSIDAPIGIAACPLGISKGIKLLSQFGFSIFTYKTIRSQGHPTHPMPNIAYLICNKQLALDDLQTPFVASPYNKSTTIAIANSFGSASFDINRMSEDIAQSKQMLSPKQLFIVSVYGTPQENRTLIKDYILTAHIAQDAGAQVIECNVSCPNIPNEKPLYLQPEQCYKLIKDLKKNIALPITVKIGLCKNIQELEKLLITIARAGAQAVSMINSISAEIINKHNQPYFDRNRTRCGISGDPIRSLALKQIAKARKIIDKEKLNLAILGCGGITQPEHIDQFLHAGADIAMSATGVMHNPYLAIEWYESKSDHPSILRLPSRRQRLWTAGRSTQGEDT